MLLICRDLKPENILLGDDMHIQITDFGSAKIFETEGEGTIHVVMSFYYLSGNFVFIFALISSNSFVKKYYSENVTKNRSHICC